MRKTLILLASLIVALSSPLSAGTGFDPLLGRIVTVPPASRLSYSTSTSGLSEANVQGAIDELATMIADVTTGGLSDIDQLPGDTTDDDKIDLGLLTTTPSFESMTLTGAAGLTLGVAGTTQGALVIASNTHAVYKNTIVPGTMTESVSWRLPGAMPAGADYLVNCDVTTGQMGYTNPATFQAADTDLTIWAGVTPSANGQSLVSAANYAAMRGLLDLEAGTDFNAYDYDLGTLASGITGIVKGGGNGGGFSAASAGTDYLAPAAIGTTVQGLDSDLTALAGISGQRGDVIYYGSAGWTRLAKGTENYVLTQGANDPAWAAATGGGASTLDDLTDAVITSAEQGDVLYFNGTNWVNLAHGSAGQYLKTGGNAANPSWDTPSGAGDMLASAYPAIAAIEALNFADASIIQLTGADASAVLTSGGNNYILGSNSDNSALEFKTPANVLSQIGAQAASAVLTTYAGINPTANVQTMLGSANNAAILSNIGAQTADSDLTTLSAPTAWRVFYSNGSQAVTELALGADGTFLESNGASAAPAFRTLALADLPTITPSKGGTGVANNDASTLTISGNYATTLTVTGATGVTLPTSGTLAALAGANTWTGNNTFGDGDGDTLTSRGIIVGGDRTGSNDAVQIAATLASPTYATGTNELYVAGDIETAGNVYATQFIGAATGDSYVQLANNSGGLSGSGYRLWFETDTTDQLKYSINGTEKAVVNVEDAQTISGAKTLSSALTINRGATGAGQLVISEDSDDGTNAVTITGQAMASSYTLTLPADDGTNGQALLTNGSGTTSWGSVSATAAGDAAGQVQYNTGGTGGSLAAEAAFSYDATNNALTIGANALDGTLILYNESGETDYNLTIQPGTQSGAATITMPGSTATLATLGLAETLSGAKTFSANVTLDDGTGASPSFTFQDGTDETAVFSKADSGVLSLTTLAADGFNLLTGNLWVGNGTPGQTINGEDAYIEGLLEVDGAAYLDGGIASIGAASNLSGGTVTLGAIAGTVTMPTGSIALGADPGDSGAIRLSNNTALAWEQSTPGTDIFIALDSSDILQVGQNAAQITLGTSGTGNVTVTGDLTVTGSDINVGAAGVKLTGDGDGAITFLGLGDGSDEDLTLNLDDTANTAKFSSSTGVTTIDLSAIALLTTGQVRGAVDVNLISTATTMGAADCLGSFNEVTAATTVTLPSIADVPVGATVCFYVRDASEQASIYPHHDDRFVLDGTAMAEGEAVLSPSGATSAGAFISFIHDDADGWRSLGMARTWTQATP